MTQPKKATGSAAKAKGAAKGKTVAKGKPKRSAASKKSSKKDTDGRYVQAIEKAFAAAYSSGDEQVDVTQAAIAAAAKALKLEDIANLPDVIYAFRHGRQPIPDSIATKAPKGMVWTIDTLGRRSKNNPGGYRFKAEAPTKAAAITPNPHALQIKVPDSTPGVIARYALKEHEQSLLAKLRYSRLVDIFTGVACYSLQTHLRTSVGRRQVEADEIYVGVDKSGAHYILPLEAKGPSDSLSLRQIEDDIALVKQKWPGITIRPLAAKFMADAAIAMFEFIEVSGEVKVSAEKHYRLVPEGEITDADLAQYKLP